MAHATSAFPPGIRHTEAAGRILEMAQQVARSMQWAEVRTEHLLVATVAEQEGHAARALKALGVSAATITATVEEMLGPGRGATPGDLAYTARSRRVLSETAVAAAKALGHEQVGSAHILLALINEDHAALQVLYRLGVSADSVREEIALLLGIPAIPPIHSTGEAAAEPKAAVVTAVTTQAVPQAAPQAPAPMIPTAHSRPTDAPALLTDTDAGVPLSPQVLAALVAAHEAAQQRKHTQVKAEHLLLGLLLLPQPNKLASVLAEHGLTAEVLAHKLFD